MLEITGCSDSSFWYRQLIGARFEIYKAVPEGWLVREPAGFLNIILLADAQVVCS